MGCLLACFGGSKSQKNRYENDIGFREEYKPVSVTNVAERHENYKKPINLVPESGCKPEELLSLNTRRKVTLDSNVKEHEHISDDEAAGNIQDSEEVVTRNCTQEPLSLDIRKKVPLDSNVKEYEHIYDDEAAGNIKDSEEVVTQNCNKEPLSLDSKKKVTFDSNVKEYEHISDDEAARNMQGSEKWMAQNYSKSGNSPSVSESGSTLSSSGSYPLNHRYQNCRESDDDEEELDYKVSDLDEDEDEDEIDESHEIEVYDDEYSDEDYHSRNVQESSAGSCSSMESSTKGPASCVVNDGQHDSISSHQSSEIDTKTPEFNHTTRNRAGYVHSVLNPVENTAQWKVVKAKGTPLLKQQKENSQMETNFKQFTVKSKTKFDEPRNNNEVAVDASLSTWLVSSQKTPPDKAQQMDLELISSDPSLSSYGSNSMKSQKESSILGAVTVKDLKQFSAASSSPRKSPNKSSDERPLVGTVGVLWNDRTPSEDTVSASSFNGIPNTTSKYREDRRVNWHSTPFETRLEKALNRDAAALACDCAC